MDKPERIIIDTGNEGKYRVVGNLRLCRFCKINYTMHEPCILCVIRLELENKLERKPTDEEWEKAVKEWGMD